MPLLYDLKPTEHPPTRFALPFFARSGFAAGLALCDNTTVWLEDPAHHASAPPESPAYDAVGCFALALYGVRARRCTRAECVGGVHAFHRRARLLLELRSAVGISLAARVHPSRVVPLHCTTAPRSAAPQGPGPYVRLAHAEAVQLIDGRAVDTCAGELEKRDFAPARMRCAIISAEWVGESSMWARRRLRMRRRARQSAKSLRRDKREWREAGVGLGTRANRDAVLGRGKRRRSADRAPVRL
jgi:hypothetical protein